MVIFFWFHKIDGIFQALVGYVQTSEADDLLYGQFCILEEVIVLDGDIIFWLEGIFEVLEVFEYPVLVFVDIFGRYFWEPICEAADGDFEGSFDEDDVQVLLEDIVEDMGGGSHLWVFSHGDGMFSESFGSSSIDEDT